MGRFNKDKTKGNNTRIPKFAFALHAELEKNTSLESVNACIVVKTTKIAVLTQKYNENEVISKRTLADADAYAIQMLQEQLAKSNNYIEYEKILKWDGKLPQVQGDSNAIIDMRDDTAQQTP